MADQRGMVRSKIGNDSGATSSRVFALDVLRGCAIAFVLLRHAAPNLFGGAGVVGVTMFFTLSGYLITGVLANEYHAREHLRLRRFYLNRALRLWPALLIMLIVFGAVEETTDRLHDKSIVPRSIAAGAVYVTDLPTHVTPGLGHLWTLATEEQFYLIWPFVLAFALRRKASGRVILLVAGLSYLVLIATAVAKRHDISVLYTLPTSWAITLVIGGAAYLYQDAIKQWRGLPVAAAVGAVVLVALAFPSLKSSALTYLLGGPAIALATSAVILHASRTRTEPAWLRLAMGLGLVSYGTYLWNYPIVQWLQGARSTPTAAEAVSGVAFSVGAGVASFWLIERPVRHLRRRMQSPDVHPE